MIRNECCAYSCSFCNLGKTCFYISKFIKRFDRYFNQLLPTCYSDRGLFVRLFLIIHHVSLPLTILTYCRLSSSRITSPSLVKSLRKSSASAASSFLKAFSLADNSVLTCDGKSG